MLHKVTSIMMIVLLFAFVSLANAAQISNCPVCRLNEVLSSCSFPCEPNCQDPKRPPCETLWCGTPNCICKPGFIREVEGGKCIPIEKCPRCGPNEEMTDGGFDCMTCQNRMYVRCAYVKERKCRCKEGYIRSDDGSCISMEQCLLDDECRAQGPNLTYYPISKPCPKVCPGQDPILCAVALIPGCGCKKGYLWDTTTKTCVHLRECPVKNVCSEIESKSI